MIPDLIWEGIEPAQEVKWSVCDTGILAVKQDSPPRASGPNQNTSHGVW